MQDLIPNLDDVSRRQFAAYAAKACLGVSLFPFAGSAFAADGNNKSIDTPIGKIGTAKNVIYLWMGGGVSHVDTFDPKLKGDGPVETIQTSVSGLRISKYFPELAKQMDKVALIRSLTSNQGDHAPGTYLWKTSYEQQTDILHPAMGAWVLRLSGQTNKSLPGNVRIGGGSNHPGAGYMEARHAPLPIGDPTAGLQNSTRPVNVKQEQFEKRLSIANELDKKFRTRFKQRQVRSYIDAYADAIRLMSSKDLATFDLSQETNATHAAYGPDSFSKGCLLARRLVEQDVRFVEVTLDDWDTHNRAQARLPRNCRKLDQALSALLKDLAERGLLEKTLVVVATEFGRTPKINQDGGRDHHAPAFSCLLAGGGIKSGVVYGKSDKTGHDVIEDPVEVAQFNSTIAQALGLPIKKIITSPSGRPFTIANRAEPIRELL